MRYLVLILSLVVAFINASMGETAAMCIAPEQEYFREGLIEFSDFSCDKNQDCGLIINFPKTYQGTKFVRLSLMKGNKDLLGLLAPLLTFKEEDRLTSYMYGKEIFLEKLRFHIAYERVNGCSYWSTLELKHNKKRNEIDGFVEPPIR